MHSCSTSARESLESSIQTLQTNIETGIVTEEGYTKQVRGAIGRERRVRKRLQAQNRAKDAKGVLTLIQLMCKNLEIEILPEGLGGLLGVRAESRAGEGKEASSCAGGSGRFHYR